MVRQIKEKNTKQLHAEIPTNTTGFQIFRHANSELRVREVFIMGFKRKQYRLKPNMYKNKKKNKKNSIPTQPARKSIQWNKKD